MLKCIVSMLAVIFVAEMVVPRSAEASEWGCEVLLCAASSNPSWHDVGSCHPPMDRLISAMKQPGFSWPTCPEGGAGEPGHEKYADCPAGWVPTTGDSSDVDHFSRELSRCTRVVNTCRGGHWSTNSSGHGQRESTIGGVTRIYSGNGTCAYVEYTGRPKRSQPYYFDIRDESTGEAGRHWFDLQR